MTQGDIVRCVDNKECHGLILNETYEVLHLKGKYIAVKHKNGETCSFAKRRFIIA